MINITRLTKRMKKIRENRLTPVSPKPSYAGGCKHNPAAVPGKGHSAASDRHTLISLLYTSRTHIRCACVCSEVAPKAVGLAFDPYPVTPGRRPG